MKKTTRNSSFLICLVFLLILSLTWSCITVARTSNDPCRQKFKRARYLYKSLLKSPSKKKQRKYWLESIEAYHRVYLMYPKSSYAPRALYMVGKLYSGLYKYSRRNRDLSASEEAFRNVIKKYKNSYLADDAQYKLAESLEINHHDLDEAYLEYLKVIRNFPRGDMVKSAKARLDHIALILREKEKKKRGKNHKLIRTRLVKIKGIRHWSSKDYTRVVIDLEGAVTFGKKILPEDIKHHKPVRLCLDLNGTYLPRSFRNKVPIRDTFLKDIRIGQYKKRIVRVVLDTRSVGNYKVFALEDPFRVVVDIIGKSRAVEEKKKGVRIPKAGKLPKATLVQQLALGIKTIVIDPGHGGKDTGAIGYHHILEKRVVLSIARRLKEEIIRRHPHIRVVLTRNKDYFIPLEERTAIANAKRADLFISIHANANRNHHISGVETYFLNFATDEEAVRVAARENATTKKRISDLHSILRDLMLNSKIAESSRLASCIQDDLVKRLRKRFRNVKNHKVKEAPFYVLIGAEMPAVLVETSFVSNPMEAKRLSSPRYQWQVAKGIADGIDDYIRQVHSLALGE